VVARLKIFENLSQIKKVDMLPEEFFEYAELVIHSQPNPLSVHGGDFIHSFEWKRSPHAPLKVSYLLGKTLLQDPDIPFKLKLIDEDFPKNQVTLVRTDVPINFKVIQFLEYRWVKHCKAFNYFEARIIMTLHVWGLAYVDSYEKPSWGCVGKSRKF
jgi:hypothetical protein